MKRELSTFEWIKFHIFIDKMGITNKNIYRTILDDFRYGNLNINEFIKSYH